MKKTARWQMGDWKKRRYLYKGEWHVAEGYEMDFLLNESIQASFIAVPDFKNSVFRLRGCLVMKYADYVPKTRELTFGAEGKSFEIDV